eukprot:TRINITY_DN21298_c0_g1_i1.p1 TRINITY_DN21298_c0_g1~~TRINITY_DN21298_c0_g1_i1.p1  ORF type:complete len:167 (+),score=41.65 TRINITY_DN21298_c0_g1_i1:140-640(+)
MEKTIMHRFNVSGKKQKDLTEEQMQELKEAFDSFDVSGKGALNDRDMKQMMKQLGYTDLSKEAVMHLIVSVDEDGSGLIEFDEFIIMMKILILDRDQGSEILKAFQLFTEGERITFQDLRRLADELGEPFTDEELREMVDEGDREGRGGLDEDDFLRVMRRTGLWK